LLRESLDDVEGGAMGEIAQETPDAEIHSEFVELPSIHDIFLILN